VAQADRIFQEGKEMLKTDSSAEAGIVRIEQAYALYRNLGLLNGQLKTLRYLVDIRGDHDEGPARAREILRLDETAKPDALTRAQDDFRLGTALYYGVNRLETTYDESDVWLKNALKLLASQNSIRARQIEAEVASLLGISYGMRAQLGMSAKYWKVAERSARLGHVSEMIFQRRCEMAVDEIHRGYYHDAWMDLQSVIDWVQQRLRRMDGIRSWDQVRSLQTLVEYSFERQGIIAALYGNYAQAITLEERAIRASRNARVNRIVECQTDIAEFSDSLGQQNLDRQYDQLLRMAPSSGDTTNFITVRRAYADFLLSKGRYNEALVPLQQTYLRAMPNGFLQFIPDYYISVGGIRIRQKLWVEALKQYSRAWELVGSYDLPTFKWRIYVGKGRALEGLGRPDDALHEYQKAIAELSRYYHRVSPSVATCSAEVAGYVEPFQRAFDLSWRLGNTRAAFQAIENSRSRMLLPAMVAGGREVRVGLSPSDHLKNRELEDEWTAAHEAFLSASDDPGFRATDRDRLQARIARINRKRNAFDASLRWRATEPGQEVLTTPVSFSSLPKLARASDSVILNYVVTEDHLYLFVADAKGVYPYRLAITRQELDITSRRLLKQLSSPNGEALPLLASHLYAVLVGVAEPHLRSARTLSILPDGPLWNVPFAALVRDKGGIAPYLVERYALTYAPSATALREFLRRDRTGVQLGFPRTRHVAVLCNPTASQGLTADGRGESFRSIMSDHAVANLHSSDVEAAYIRSVDPIGTAVFHGQAATPERARMALGQYSTVHFATHARTVKDSPMSSYLLLARDAGGGDGVLEARDLAAIKIRARFIVFAACGSAQGRNVSGEGLVGLTWAAFIGGAASQMASLWDVQDRATADLMAGFYRNRSTARSPAIALQRAQCNMIRRGYRPFQWAAFIVLGADTHQ
jgi:CHAT domain-containing protein/tetratricopeptide (TPR) repeat protein